MAPRLAILIASAVLAGTRALPHPYERPGPSPGREGALRPQPLLSLPATSPAPLARGHYEARLDGDWGSDFSVVEGVGGRLSYLVDGEHRSGALNLRRGFGGGLTLGLRASVLWRGRGIMDGTIDWWHRTLGFPDAGRSQFPDNRFRVEGRDTSGRALAWKGRGGTGLGNLEVEAHQVLFGLENGSGWRAAAVARLSAPTASGPFADAGGPAALQLVAAHPLGGRTNVYFGLGTTVQSRREVEGLQYRRTRPQGFLTFEGRLTRGWSIVVQLDAASRLVTNVESYPGSLVYLRVGSKFGLHGGWMLEGGITEGVKNQVAATDFGVLAAVGRRF